MYFCQTGEPRYTQFQAFVASRSSLRIARRELRWKGSERLKRWRRCISSLRMKLLTSRGHSQWMGGGAPRSGMPGSVREVARRHRHGAGEAHRQGQAGKMKVIKRRGHRLFEQDTEAACPYCASGHTVRLGRAVQKCQASQVRRRILHALRTGPTFF
jgi:hypothetical protein